MGWEDLTDFEREMCLAVVEEASLAELPRGVNDGVFGGGVLGPWDPEACSAHLLRWFDQGLIELYEFGDESPGPIGQLQMGPDRVLPSSIGRERLAAWDRWGDDGKRWWTTCLVMTERGVAGLGEAAGLTS
jgi:hypothetical protein